MQLTGNEQSSYNRLDKTLTDPEDTPARPPLGRNPDGTLMDEPASLWRTSAMPGVAQGAKPGRRAPSAVSSVPPTGCEIIEEIGRGGMSVVYRARETGLHREVALKRLLPNYAASEKAVARMLREARAIANVQHPNIVHVYAVGQDESGPFIAMELVCARDDRPLTLDQKVKRDGPLSETEAVDLVRTLCTAAQAAHDKGIIHRDIKPSNVLLTAQGDPKLADFGIAHAAADTLGGTLAGLTVEGSTLGTLDFMAPEQEGGAHAADARADVYALGGVLYFCLTGKTMRHFRESEVPPALRAVICKATEHAPDRRYATASELAEALSQSIAVTVDFGHTYPASADGSICPQCGRTASSGHAFCEGCGSELSSGPMSCRSCGREMDEGARFCPSCGESIRTDHSIRERDTHQRTDSEDANTEPGTERSVDLGNGISLMFCWCPATTSATWKAISGGEDTFLMGSPSDEKGRDTEELQHSVKLTRGFWIGKYPVTQQHYDQLMMENPSFFKKGKLFGVFGGHMQHDHPVECVSWEDAKKFSDKLQERLEGEWRGWSVRLPTEAEWEYACRAGSTAALYSGKEITSEGNRCRNLDDIAWYSENSGYTTKPVGQKQPNAWGLYDMLGNVCEWCEDCRRRYTVTAEVDPVGSGTPHLFRGGSWRFAAGVCRCANRSRYVAGDYFNNRGFRVVVAR